MTESAFLFDWSGLRQPSVSVEATTDTGGGSPLRMDGWIQRGLDREKT